LPSPFLSFFSDAYIVFFKFINAYSDHIILALINIEYQNMKTILAFLCFFTIYTSESKLTITDELITLSINKTTTNEQLADFKQQLAKKKILLTVERIDRSPNNEIRFIRISVNCNDGFKGASQKQFSDADSAIGFYRSYKAGSDSAFGMQPSVKD
jgi:hypothetical protein